MGILGKNGAGKTTIFKLLTGLEPIVDGEAWLKGFSIRKHLLQTYKYFGYCSEEESFLDDLRGDEWMEIVCRIRGVQSQHIKFVSHSLANALGMTREMHKKIKEMSNGNRRKMSTALAMVAAPQVVYLDEPTTGMDPSSKRYVWDVVEKYRKESGGALIVISHSMDECEALCTRLIVLLDGKMEAIATSFRLKQKFSKTGHLLIQIGKDYSEDPVNAGKLFGALVREIDSFVVK